jgi:hypothetical protein
METRRRLIASWVLMVAGIVLATASLVAGFTGDPGQGEGWGGGIAEAVFLGVPLAGVGWALRSDRVTVRRRTAVVALVLAALAGFVLVMQLADANETTLDRLVSGLGLVLYTGAALLEASSFARRTDGPGQATPSPPRKPARSQ